MQRFITPLSHRLRGVYLQPPFDWWSPGLNYLNTYFTYTCCHNKQRQNLKYSQTLLCTLMAVRAWMVLQTLAIIQWNAQTAWVNMQINMHMHRCNCMFSHTCTLGHPETHCQLLQPQARFVKCACLSVFLICVGSEILSLEGMNHWNTSASAGMRGFTA